MNTANVAKDFALLSTDTALSDYTQDKIALSFSGEKRRAD